MIKFYVRHFAVLKERWRRRSATWCGCPLWYWIAHKATCFGGALVERMDISPKENSDCRDFWGVKLQKKGPCYSEKNTRGVIHSTLEIWKMGEEASWIITHKLSWNIPLFSKPDDTVRDTWRSRLPKTIPKWESVNTVVKSISYIALIPF